MNGHDAKCEYLGHSVDRCHCRMRALEAEIQQLKTPDPTHLKLGYVTSPHGCDKDAEIAKVKEDLTWKQGVIDEAEVEIAALMAEVERLKAGVGSDFFRILREAFTETLADSTVNSAIHRIQHRVEQAEATLARVREGLTREKLTIMLSDWANGYKRPMTAPELADTILALLESK